MYPPGPTCFLADDLSGALEVGAVFHRLNRDVRVSLKPELLPAWDTGTVLGFDADSRAKTSGDAYQTVFDLTKAVGHSAHPLILKKIDSTMRGWIGQEIQAVLDSECADAVALCPTNPAAGRTVGDGVLLVEGVPVDQTAFNRDPAFPIRHSRLDEIIRSQTDLPLRHCPLQRVRSSGDSLTTWIADTTESEIPILSFDAVTEEDLTLIAQATLSSKSRILPCGSGAMAAAVGGVLGRRTGKAARARDNRSVTGRPRTAFLIGSAHPNSMAQFENLARDRPLAVCRFDPNDPDSWSNTFRTCLRALKEGVIALLPEVQRGEQPMAETAKGIQAFFRLFAETTQLEERPQNWFITGGETARSVIDALSIQYLDIVDELEPGVAAAVTTTSDPIQTHPNDTLITKPGGFGHPNTLVHCYDYLTVE